MANVIDALLVTLGMDAANFKKGAKETDATLAKTSGAAIKTSKDMEAWGKNAAASMGKLRNEVLGLLAVFTAGVGIKNFVENTINSTASLGRLSQNLGMSAKDLAMWQLANKNAGGSVEGMTAQLKEAQQAVADYKMGRDNAANKAFWNTTFAKHEDFKDVETLLRARADAVAKIIAKQGMAVGRSRASEIGVNEDSFQLLKNGAAAADDVRRSVEGLAGAQASAADKAEAFRQKWDLLKDQFDVIGTQIVSNLLPTLNRIAQWLSDNQDKIKEWSDKTVEAFGLFAQIVVNVARIAGPILGVIADGWKNIYGWVKITGEAISRILPPKWLDKIGEGTAWLFDKLGIRGQVDSMLAGGGSKAGGAATSGPGPAGSTKFSELESKYGLPSGLIDAVWKQESGRGKNMRSPAGAMGHFQFMPATAKQYGLKNPDDLAESSDAAARMYRDLLQQNGGNLPKALAGYNWGQGNLQRQGLGAAPKETRDYIAQIQRQMATGGTPANAVNTLAQAGRRGGSASGAGGTSTSETNINGPINIVTRATDAEGIARSIGPALGKYAFASQSNTGLD